MRGFKADYKGQSALQFQIENPRNNELTLQSFGGASFGRSQTMIRFRPEDLAR
jgi:hypothetical protein